MRWCGSRTTESGVAREVGGWLLVKLGFQLCPARKKFIHHLLCRFEFGVRGEKTSRVGGDGWIFSGGFLLSEYFFSVGDALFDGGVLASFDVRKFLFGGT